MSDVMYLWKETAPYSEFSPEQAQPSLTPFPVSGSKGAVVVIPGGAYCMKADHEGAPIARMLNDAGISAYVLDYRVRPCHKLAPLADANRAIRLVRSLGYEKVAILGFSAGGNLCCNAATHYDLGNPDSDDPIERCSSRPDGFIPCYAVVSMISYTHKGSVQNLLGDEQNKDSELRYFSGELNGDGRIRPRAFICTRPRDGSGSGGKQSGAGEGAVRPSRAVRAACVPEGRARSGSGGRKSVGQTVGEAASELARSWRLRTVMHT